MEQRIAPDGPHYRFILPEEFRKELATMEWESIAQYAADLNFRDQKAKAENTLLLRELELAKLILLETISEAKHRKPPAKMLVKTVRLLQRCETLAKRHDVDLSDFALFLSIVIEKMKKEKLVVYQPHSHSPQPKAAQPEDFSQFKEMVERKSRV